MRTFELRRNGTLVAEVVLWKDKSVTLRTDTEERQYQSLATLLVLEVSTPSDVLVEVDSQGNEGQRWQGQEDADAVAHDRY